MNKELLLECFMSLRGNVIKGVCGRARSLIPAGVIPVPARQVSHRIANIGQAEVTPNVKHDGRKPAGRKRKLK